MNRSFSKVLTVTAMVIGFGFSSHAQENKKEDTLNGANMGSGSSTAQGTDTTGRGAPGYGKKHKSPPGTGQKQTGKAPAHPQGTGQHSDPTTGSKPE